MWKIFSEIKKKLWCNKNFCLVFKKKFISSGEMYFCTNLLEIPLTSLRFWWMTQYFGMLSIFHLTKSLQHPPHFHPQVFPNLCFLFSLLCPLRLSSPVTSFGLAWISQPVNQTPRAERGTMKERENGVVQRERPTNKLTTGCDGVTLASSLTISLSFFFLPFLLLLCTSPLEGKLNIRLHVGMLEWRGAQWKNLRADWKLSKVTIPCKTTQHIHSKPEHKTELFVFPLLCHRLNSLRMITQSQKSCCNVAPMCLCCSVR